MSERKRNLNKAIRNAKLATFYDRDENVAKNVFCLGQAISGLDPKYSESVTIQEALTFR